jgi:hypothetical protein
MKKFIKILLIAFILSVATISFLEPTSTYTPSTNIHHHAPVKRSRA